MTPETRIDTPAARGAIIRARRQARALSQQSLAEATGVSRKFLIDLEAGRDRAELGKTLAILAASACRWQPPNPFPAAVNTTRHGASANP